MSINLGGSTGLHRLVAIAQSPVGRQSSAAEYHFGYGAPSLSAPVAGQTTTDTLSVAAAGPPAGGATVTGSVQWRLSGGGDDAWTDTPAANKFTTTTTGGTASLTGLLDTTGLVGQKDASGAGPVAERRPASIDVRACFAYTPGGTRCTGPRSVVRVPHAFGSGFPVADAGPGQVGLWTGEFSLSQSDAELPAANASIQVSRTHTSFAGDVPAAQQVFGPGWVAGFDAGDGDEDSAGLSTSQVYDSTADDGTIALVTADGDTLAWTAGTRRTGADLKSGTYTPADDDTATSGITLKVSAGTHPDRRGRDDHPVHRLLRTRGRNGDHVHRDRRHRPGHSRRGDLSARHGWQGHRRHRAPARRCDELCAGHADPRMPHPQGLLHRRRVGLPDHGPGGRRCRQGAVDLHLQPRSHDGLPDRRGHWADDQIHVDGPGLRQDAEARLDHPTRSGFLSVHLRRQPGIEGHPRPAGHRERTGSDGPGRGLRL